MAKRAFVNCKQYNNDKNVKFIMDINDSRLQDDDYELIGYVDVNRNIFVHNGKSYQVFPDWSVKEISQNNEAKNHIIKNGDFKDLKVETIMAKHFDWKSKTERKLVMITKPHQKSISFIVSINNTNTTFDNLDDAIDMYNKGI